ncbi:MAG: hydroxymethylbilane synthase [Chloroflexota bacterium]
MTTTQSLKIGTRTSKLALWQTHHIIERLQAAWPGLECRIEPFVTQGDKTLDTPLPQIGGKGLFTAELEAALREGLIDIAVHSLKDLPVENAPGLTLGAVTSRAPVGDGLVAREGWTLATLPPGAIVGTSSNRRRAQLLAARPDLEIRSIRGNVQTRAGKVAEGQYHATVLAEAGLRRLGLEHLVTQWLPLDVMLPAPGQGALAVQCRAADETTLILLAAIEDEGVRTAVTAERTFLKALGGGCSAPIAAYAEILQRKDAKDAKETIRLEALVAAIDGAQVIKVAGQGSDPTALAQQLAAQAKAQGADAFLAAVDSGQFTVDSGQFTVDSGQFTVPNPQSLTPKPQPPLSGKRIVVTRSPEQAQDFAYKLAACGAEPVVFPVIRFEPLPAPELDTALDQIEQFDWLVFTSVNAAKFFFERLEEQRLKIKDLQSIYNLQSLIFRQAQDEFFNLPQIAAVGSATAVSLSEKGVPVDFMPEEFTGEKLALGLGDLTGKRVLLPRAKIGRPEIVALLREQGAEVVDVALYDTVTAVPTPESLVDLQQGFDVLTFTSPSSVRNFLKIVAAQDLRGSKNLGGLKTTIACIGPVTRDEAQKFGLTVHIMPEEYTIDGLIEAIVDYLKSKD